MYLCFVDRVFICKYGMHACVLSVIRGRGRGMLAWPVARRTCLVFGSDQKEKCRVTVKVSRQCVSTDHTRSCK